MYNSPFVPKEGIIEERLGSGGSRTKPCATNKLFQSISSLKNAFSLIYYVNLEEEQREKITLLRLQLKQVTLSVLGRPFVAMGALRIPQNFNLGGWGGGGGKCLGNRNDRDFYKVMLSMRRYYALQSYDKV